MQWTMDLQARKKSQEKQKWKSVRWLRDLYLFMGINHSYYPSKLVILEIKYIRRVVVVIGKG